MGKTNDTVAETRSMIMYDEESGNVRVVRVAMINVAKMINFIESDGYTFRSCYMTPTHQVGLVFKKKSN